MAWGCGSSLTSRLSAILLCSLRLVQTSRPVARVWHTPHQQKQSINTELGEIDRREVPQALVEANALSALYGKAAAQLEFGSPTRELLQSFRVCASCNDFKRFGIDSDGGYLTCMDGLHDGVEAALSVGVSGTDPWADDFVRQLRKPVAQLDCTVGAGSASEGCSFYKKCLVGEQGGTFPPQEMWTLSDALSGTGHGQAADRSLLLKIDIEGSEWPVFASEANAQKGLLQKFKQIIAEFHGLHKEENHDQYLAAMRRLQEAGHPPGSCLPDQDAKDLDKPNNPGGSELPPAHLPTL